MKSRGQVLSLLLFLMTNPAFAVAVVNSGFNDTTGWSVSNDATLAHPGGAAPWSWNTPVVGTVVVNATETVLPIEGAGMGITYAGADSFTQSVTFSTSGEHLFSVSANAIAGTATVGAGLPLLDGEFEFFLGAMSSSKMSVSTASGWVDYSWSANVTAGTHNLGLQNTRAAVYAIAYDSFSVSAVSEPTSLALFGLGLAGLVFRRKKKLNDF